LQVHALAILRAIVRDSILIGRLNHGDIDVVMVTAMQTFRSASWSVRNAATMLFSALLKRLFSDSLYNVVKVTNRPWRSVPSLCF
jgi:hypothetical protein